ncbi:MAG: hypothetical protein ACQETH_17365 [Candidatus Rifleibacteriota bacterium]
MIKWYTIESRLTGFTYYPLLEMGTGIFLMICSLLVPILFLIYNGLKLDQWGELLFCALFFIFFMFMGRALTFQSLKVNIKNESFVFFQNLREPPVELSLTFDQFKGIATREVEEGNETFVLLFIKSEEKEIEFYRSVNRKEINKISEALVKLGKAVKEEQP